MLIVHVNSSGKIKFRILLSVIGMLAFAFTWSCKDKYIPNIEYPPSGFLVVEGFINTGAGPTIITLTRASRLDSIQIIPETGAEIDVQSDQGASFPLTEQGTGNYSVNQLPLDPAQKYRIHIKTSNGKQYLSELSDVKITPPIDSVGWSASADAVTIYVSTHDNQDKSIYYQWNFVETWKYNAAYLSRYTYDSGNILPRPDPDSLYNCWITNQSTELNLASSENLSADVIYQFPLTKISYSTTNRLVNRYSILVKQNSISKEWYEWKEKLKKNTEELGSIFDAQPSQTGGNIVCTTDPTETVVGFVGCTSETDKRIFIDRSQIPPVDIYTGYELCSLDSVKRDSWGTYFGTGFGLPVDVVYSNGGISFVYGSSRGCVDCRIKGGTTVRPDFWQ
jgi:hypothetical protein